MLRTTIDGYDELEKFVKNLKSSFSFTYDNPKEKER